MTKTITVGYTSQRLSHHEIPLIYDLSKDAGVLVLNCKVNLTTGVPLWLQLRKFQVMAQLEEGKYNMLYDIFNESKNIDCSLFIDTAYATIMHKENMNVHVSKTV